MPRVQDAEDEFFSGALAAGSKPERYVELLKYKASHDGRARLGVCLGGGGGGWWLVVEVVVIALAVLWLRSSLLRLPMPRPRRVHSPAQRPASPSLRTPHHPAAHPPAPSPCPNRTWLWA